MSGIIPDGFRKRYNLRQARKQDAISSNEENFVYNTPTTKVNQDHTWPVLVKR